MDEMDFFKHCMHAGWVKTNRRRRWAQALVRIDIGSPWLGDMGYHRRTYLAHSAMQRLYVQRGYTIVNSWSRRLIFDRPLSSNWSRCPVVYMIHLYVDIIGTSDNPEMPHFNHPRG